jgi:hypothetical protein
LRSEPALPGDIVSSISARSPFAETIFVAGIYV